MKARTIGLAIILLMMLLSMSACTHKPFHPTKTEREWAIDHEICERWAREGIRDDPDTYDDLDEIKMIKECMRRKGWQWERTSLFNFAPQEAD